MARDGTAAAHGATPTADGVRVLRKETPPSGDGSGVLLQLLGVYRYLADPALKRQFGKDASDTLERDVFDVLLSDGRSKIKCVLSPEMNHAIWRGDLSRCDIMRVTDFDVFQVKDGDSSDATRPVCFIKGCEVIKRQSDKFLVASGTALVEKDHGDDLTFASTAASERETNVTIPIAGERMYYLPLTSDNYALLDSVESVRAEGGASTERQHCSSLFTSEAPVIHNMLDIKEMISSSGDRDSYKDKYPPMVGIVRVKSKVTHFGEPGIANPLPFVFHIVLVDSTFAFEIAFFGSSCAKYFGAIQEGDLIQLRGYSVSVTEPEGEEEDEARSMEQLLYFEHESDGEVFHIPEKFCKYLEMAEVIPKPVSESTGSSNKMTRTQSSGRQRSASSLSSPSSSPPVRLECSFATTLDTQYWSEETLSKLDTFYFDFVGVLSFAGKVCRRRKRKRAVSEGSEDGEKDGGGVEEMSSGSVGEYRWVKAVDRSSSNELVILVQDCSQPQQFYNLKAGDTVMLTKLRWVVVDDQAVRSGVDDHIFGTQYAVCSSFTVLRVNDAVSAFNAIEDCSLNSFFAEKLVAKGKMREKSSTGESWLEGGTIKKYRTRSSTVQAAEPGKLPPFLGRSVYQFSELSKVCDGLEKLEHQHVAVIGRLLSIPKQQHTDSEEAASTTTAAYEIEFGDDHDRGLSLKATLRMNPVFKVLDQQKSPPATADHNNLKGVTPKASKLLLKTLSPGIVDELFAEATSKSSEHKKKRKRKHKKKNHALKTELSSDGTTTTTTTTTSNTNNGASIVAEVVEAPTTTTTAVTKAATLAPSAKLTPEFLERQLIKSNRVFLFSTHLYRTQDGEIDVEVDAILPYALEV